MDVYTSDFDLPPTSDWQHKAQGTDQQVKAVTLV